jgi:hypothetical protein
LHTFFFEPKVVGTSPFSVPVSTAHGSLKMVGVNRPLGGNVSVDISLAALWDGEHESNGIMYMMHISMFRAVVRNEEEQQISTWHIRYIW